jgi:hypothetical protein
MLIQYKPRNAGFRQSPKEAMHKESAARLKKIKSPKINLCIFGNTYYFRSLN